MLDELKNYFKPEMLNRLDEIVCFRQLEHDSVAVIAKLMLRETAARMRSKRMEMALSHAAMAKVGRCRFNVSKPVLKARLVSALETKM